MYLRRVRSDGDMGYNGFGTTTWYVNMGKMVFLSTVYLER